MAAMMVYRVQRNDNFIVMTTYHLHDHALSLKARGLLSTLLALPEDWDFSLKGLAAICKEGVDAIREAVKELETNGYLIRSRIRNEKGQMDSTACSVYEYPQGKAQLQTIKQSEKRPAYSPIPSHSPMEAHPAQEEPALEKPTLVFPTLEKPAEPNKSYPVTPKNKNINIIPKESYPYPYPSHPDPVNTGNIRHFPTVPQSQPADQENTDPTESLWQTIQEKVGYEALSQDYGKEKMDEIVGIIVGALLSTRICFRFGNDVVPSKFVKKQLFSVNSHHIEYVFGNLKKTASLIHDPKAYLLTCIYNATLTMNTHIEANVQHDVYQHEKRKEMLLEESIWDQTLEDIKQEEWEDIINEIKGADAGTAPESGCAFPVNPADGGSDADRVRYCYAG